MKRFGYVIDPRNSGLYNIQGSINKIMLNIPLLKEEVIKISDIYDKKNNNIGSILSVPFDEENKIYSKLIKYGKKHDLDFICMGDGIRRINLSNVRWDTKIISGVYGIAYITYLIIKKRLSLINKSIYDSNIVFVIDECNHFTKEFIKVIVDKTNYITITGNLKIQTEGLLKEIYDKSGLSIGIISKELLSKNNCDVIINLCNTYTYSNIILNNDIKDCLIIDFFSTLRHSNSTKNILINHLEMSCNEVIIFNKLDIINNFYSPQLIESIARINNHRSNKEVIESIKCVIEAYDFQLI